MSPDEQNNNPNDNVVNTDPLVTTPTNPPTPQPTTDQAQIPLPQNSQQPPQKSTTDVLGIISIVLAFVGFQLIGFILGLVGASKAKKEGRSPILSRIGWILNLVLGLIVMLIVSLIFLAAISTSNISNQASNQNLDMQSKADINNLHTGLEVFFNDNGYYPESVSTTTLYNVTSDTLTDADGNSIKVISGKKTETEAKSVTVASGYIYVPYDCVNSECSGYVLKAKILYPDSSPSGVNQDPFVKTGLNN